MQKEDIQEIYKRDDSRFNISKEQESFMKIGSEEWTSFWSSCLDRCKTKRTIKTITTQDTIIMKEKEKKTDNLPVSIDYDDKSMTVQVIDKEKLEDFFLSDDQLSIAYEKVNKFAKGLIADPTNKEGATQIKAMGRNIASIKARFDEIRLYVVKDLKDKPRRIDEAARLFKRKLESLQEEVLAPVKEIEERKALVDSMRKDSFNYKDSTSQEIGERINELLAFKVDNSWKESKEEMEEAVLENVSKLNELLLVARKREKDAADLAVLRAKEAEHDRIIREEQIRKDAEAKAKAEAEKAAELERLRIEQLEKEKINAEAKIKLAEEMAKKADERAKQAEEEAKRVREEQANKPVTIAQPVITEPEQQSMANPQPELTVDEEREKKREINRAILIDFSVILLKLKVDDSEGKIAKALATAVIKKEIRNVEVKYDA
jgi:hypothetical protein